MGNLMRHLLLFSPNGKVFTYKTSPADFPGTSHTWKCCRLEIATLLVTKPQNYLAFTPILFPLSPLGWLFLRFINMGSVILGKGYVIIPLGFI